MKASITALLVSVLLLSSCVKGTRQNAPMVGKSEISIEDCLIEKKFRDNNTFVIICKGYPKHSGEGLNRFQREAEMKRAALLNAYYFVKRTFNDRIKPDKYGRPEMFEIKDGYAIVHYVIKKFGLKSMRRKERNESSK